MSKPRHIRHKPSPCVACAAQSCRHIRHTPLGGVTIVTLGPDRRLPCAGKCGGLF